MRLPNIGFVQASATNLCSKVFIFLYVEFTYKITLIRTDFFNLLSKRQLWLRIMFLFTVLSNCMPLNFFRPEALVNSCVQVHLEREEFHLVKMSVYISWRIQ